MKNKIIKTQYTVDIHNDNFQLIISQEFAEMSGSNTHWHSVAFEFTNYAALSDHIDSLKAIGVEMAR